MAISTKYGRTYHFPFSPGTTSDDRIYSDYWPIFPISRPWFILKKWTEKITVWAKRAFLPVLMQPRLPRPGHRTYGNGGNWSNTIWAIWSCLARICTPFIPSSIANCHRIFLCSASVTMMYGCHGKKRLFMLPVLIFPVCLSWKLYKCLFQRKHLKQRFCNGQHGQVSLIRSTSWPNGPVRWRA